MKNTGAARRGVRCTREAEPRKIQTKTVSGEGSNPCRVRPWNTVWNVGADFS